MLRFNLIVMAVLLMAVARAAEPSYVIHFDEADHKGDRASFERSTATIIHTSTKLDGQDEARESETTIGMKLRGDWEVLAADEAAANSTAESMTVRSWTRKVEDNGKVVTDKAVLPPGAKVTSRLVDGETTYAVRIDDEDEENEPSRELKSLLPGVMMLHKSEGRTRDSAIFGGSKPRTIGDIWPIDAQAAANVYRENQLDVRAKDITGTVKLLDVQTYNGRECLHVAVDTDIADFRVTPSTKLADRDEDDGRYKLKSASMTSHVEWLIDAAGDEKHFASFSTVRNYHGEGTVRSGAHYTSDQAVRMETRIRRLAGSHATTTTASAPKSDP